MIYNDWIDYLKGKTEAEQDKICKSRLVVRKFLAEMFGVKQEAVVILTHRVYVANGEGKGILLLRKAQHILPGNAFYVSYCGAGIGLKIDDPGIFVKMAERIEGNKNLTGAHSSREIEWEISKNLLSPAR